MSSFQARLGTPGQPRLPLQVEIDINGGEAFLRVGGARIADWQISDLTVVPHGDGFRITAGGEELIVAVTDPVGFAEEMGLNERRADRVKPLAGWWAHTSSQPTA